MLSLTIAFVRLITAEVQALIVATFEEVTFPVTTPASVILNGITGSAFEYYMLSTKIASVEDETSFS